jgi:ribosomal protein L44E
VSCVCKKSIHELAKANPNKAYKVLEQERAEQATYEHNGGMVKPLNKRKEKYV